MEGTMNGPRESKVTIFRALCEACQTSGLYLEHQDAVRANAEHYVTMENKPQFHPSTPRLVISRLHVTIWEVGEE